MTVFVGVGTMPNQVYELVYGAGTLNITMPELDKLTNLLNLDMSLFKSMVVKDFLPVRRGPGPGSHPSHGVRGHGAHGTHGL